MGIPGQTDQLVSEVSRQILGSRFRFLNTRTESHSSPEFRTSPGTCQSIPGGGGRGGGSVCPCIAPRSALLGAASTSAAAASIGLTTPPSTAPGAPRGLAAAVRPVGSAVVGPAAPVVAQAAAPTPRAAAAPGAGAAAAPGADITAGGDWGALWGAFRGGALGDALGRGLALLLVLLAGHLGGRVQELRERQTAGQTSTQRPPCPFLNFWHLSRPFILKAFRSDIRKSSLLC